MKELKDFESHMNIFKLILTFKNVKKKSEYIIDADDMKLIWDYWRVYKLYKHISLKKYRKCVVEYSVFAGIPFYKSCEELSKKIII